MGGESVPAHKFLNLFARYADSFYKDKSMPYGMAKGRIEERIKNVRKRGYTIEFSIIRHPYAWGKPEISHEVLQRWNFNINNGLLTLIE